MAARDAITFKALETDADSITFERSIAEGSLTSITVDGGTTLASDQITLTFDKNLDQLLCYEVQNGSARNSIEELICTEPDINPDADHKVQLHGWHYGFTSTLNMLAAIDDSDAPEDELSALIDVPSSSIADQLIENDGSARLGFKLVGASENFCAKARRQALN